MVKKQFAGKMYFGKITDRGYEGQSKTYKIIFDDGDVMVVNEQMLKDMVV